VLAAAGGAIGVLLASWGAEGLIALRPRGIPRFDGVGVDLSVLGFAAAITLLTGVGFGLAPVLAWHHDSYSSLRETGRGMTAGIGRQRFRRGLIVSELALALVLLAGAGLLLRSFVGLLRVDPGFDTENILTVRLTLLGPEYSEDAQRRAFYASLVERISAAPGVTGAGAVTNLPLTGSLGDLNFHIEGRPEREGDVSPRLDWQAITPGYFEAIGMRMVRGRGITLQDDARAPGAVVINETGARTIFPGEDALGKRFRLGGDEPAGPGTVTVVGIVRDIRHSALGEPPRGEMYIPHAQFTFWNGGPAAATMTLAVRASGDAARLAPMIRREIAALDSDLPPGAFRTMSEVAGDSISRQRFVMLLLGIFSAIALLLATIGIYGVIAYSVSQRTHELGIRMALGARRVQVLGLVLRQGLTMIGAGLAIGLVAALTLTRRLADFLYDVRPHDPLTLVGVAAALGAAALLACLGPARRATRVDPMVSLRSE
jgi:putative ABC transport system permease protein